MQVPYSPVPGTEANAPFSLPQNPQGISPAAFGGNVAQAVGGLGKTVGEAADTQERDVLAMQALNNQSAALEGDVNFATKLGDIQNKLYSLTGKQAMDAYPQAIQDMKALRDKVLADAPNPMAQKMLAQTLEKRFAYAVTDAGRHVAQQTKQYNNDAFGARIKLNNEQAQSAEDDDRFKTLNTATLNDIQVNGQQNGLPQEKIDQLKAAASGSAWTGRITYISMSDPERAYKLYQDNKGDIPATAYPQIERALDTSMRTVWSAKAAQDIYQESGGKDYYQKLIHAESGGKSDASPGTSSALGLGQFTSGTWNNLADKHPELGLTKVTNTTDGRTDDDQQRKALKAFTADNAKILEGSGIEPTEKNLRMTHFLGAGDGPAFLNVLKNNPNQIAAELLPKAAQANHNVFYNADGTARTVQEVYNLETRGFSDNRLGVDNSLANLAAMQEKGKELAAQYPNVPGLAEAVTTHLTQLYNVDKAQARAEVIENLGSIQSAILNGQAKSIDDIKSSPKLYSSFMALDPQRQNTLLYMMSRQNANPPMTPERLQTYESLKGQAINDPKGFADSFDPSKVDLPFTMLKELQGKQLQIQHGMDQPKEAVQSSMSYLKSIGMFDQLHIKPNSPQYHQITAALDTGIQQFVKDTGRQPRADELQKMAVTLTRQEVTSKGWLWDSHSPAYTQPGAGLKAESEALGPVAPKEFVEAANAQWATKHPGQTLNNEQIGTLWRSNSYAWRKSHGFD